MRATDGQAGFAWNTLTRARESTAQFGGQTRGVPVVTTTPSTFPLPAGPARARESFGNDDQFESHTLDTVDSFAGGVGHRAVQVMFGHRMSPRRFSEDECRRDDAGEGLVVGIRKRLDDSGFTAGESPHGWLIDGIFDITVEEN